jgi:hypothetical protein
MSRRSKYRPPAGRVLKNTNKNADAYWNKKRGEKPQYQSATLAELELRLAKIGKENQ